MEYFNGCTYGFMSPRGFTQKAGWKVSLQKMVETTGCDTLLLPVGALQDHAYSVKVDYETPDVMSFDDVRNVCAYARELGLKIILKAMVNCRDGYWRAYIRFIDNYVPSEPTWGEWFESYGRFVCELAKVAQEVEAEMYCIGCEMVGTDHRADEWRALIREVRKHYTGPITYNCDKFQEDYVTWWDAVDVISSSGYYPIDQLDHHFARIQAVAEKFDRPFMFMECGCPSRDGSQYVPNNWNFGGELSQEAQRLWFDAFCQCMLKNPWVRGNGWWDWSAMWLYPREKAMENNGYCTYGKPSEQVLQQFSARVAERETTK
jgi:hypothetical protein